MRTNYTYTDDHVIFINNDTAMMPQLMPGSLLAGHYIETSTWHMQSSGVFAIVLDSGRVYIRRLKENDMLTKGTLTLYSDNPAHPTEVIDGDNIHSIYMIEEILKQVVV